MRAARRLTAVRHQLHQLQTAAGEPDDEDGAAEAVAVLAARSGPCHELLGKVTPTVSPPVGGADSRRSAWCTWATDDRRQHVVGTSAQPTPWRHPERHRRGARRPAAGAHRHTPGAERPLSAISMQDVADRLGPTKGNLYHYFASEHDLLSHCHLRGMQDSLRLLDAAAETDDPRWSYWPSSG